MERELLDLINVCEDILNKGAKDEIWHYYTHGEFEMALEGLLIEVCDKETYPHNYDISKIIELATHYKLNEDSVFDNHIWKKIIKWAK